MLRLQFLTNFWPTPPPGEGGDGTPLQNKDSQKGWVGKENVRIVKERFTSVSEQLSIYNEMQKSWGNLLKDTWGKTLWVHGRMPVNIEQIPQEHMGFTLVYSEEPHLHNMWQLITLDHCGFSEFLVWFAGWKGGQSCKDLEVNNPQGKGRPIKHMNVTEKIKWVRYCRNYSHPVSKWKKQTVPSLAKPLLLLPTQLFQSLSVSITQANRPRNLHNKQQKNTNTKCVA